MTIKQNIKKYGWEIECNPQRSRIMRVDAGFIINKKRYAF